MYGTPGGDLPPLDDFWQIAEQRLESVEGGLGLVRRCGAAPAGWFVLDAAPYVGHLLARALPMTVTTDLDLHPGASRELLTDRFLLAFVLIDRVLTRSRWTLAEAPASSPWVSNDLGPLVLPGHGSGSILLPVSPQLAVVLSHGTPTYIVGQDSVEVPTYVWTAEDVAVINDALALGAPREVYTSLQPQADRAIQLWSDPGIAAVTSAGISARVLEPIKLGWHSMPLIEGTPIDPALSRARFMAATHDHACNCAQLLAQQSPAHAATLEQDAHRDLEIGRASLQRDRRMLRSGGRSTTRLLGAAIDDDRVAIATRAGLRIITPGRAARIGAIDRSSVHGRN